MNILEKAQAEGAKIHLKTSGVNLASGSKDLAAFTGEIDASEKILCIITGKLVKMTYNKRGKGTPGEISKGVLVITDQKAVFMDKRLFGKQVTIIDGTDINSVSAVHKMFTSAIVIVSEGRGFDITDVKKEGADDAVAALQSLKKLSKAPMGGTTVHQAASGMEEIKKAKELLDAGIISQADFEKVKAKHL